MVTAILSSAAGMAAQAWAATRMIPESFADVAEKIGPAVVNISTVRIVRQPLAGQPGTDDPLTQEFFERFFGEQLFQDIPQKSLGSGVIVDRRGYVLTNNHVIDKASEISVKLKDGKEYGAEIVGADPKTDLAVLKLKGRDVWPAADLGDSDAIRVGDWVLALGSPFGLEQTVTAGIISAKSRTIGQGPYDNFLQTDASINPGNSGGPLVNLEGQVIGINTAIFSNSGGSLGIGFAIPANMANKIYSDIVKTGGVRRGWMGIYIQPLTPELARHFHLKASLGVLVSAVVPGGPADQGGLKPGDVVTSFNQKSVRAPNDMMREVAQASENQVIDLEVVREGEVKTLKIRVGDQGKAERKPVNFKPQEADKPAPTLGIEIRDLTASAGRPRGTRNLNGVLVVSVTPGSPADGAGINEGDVIREVNRQGIGNVKQFVQQLRSLKPGDDLLLLVERRDYAIYVAMKIPEK
jgi:serine protease Do